MPVYSYFAYSPSTLTFNSSTYTWTLDPAFDHRVDRVQIDITDDDSIFNGDSAADEIGNDSNQTAVVTLPDGTPVASGQVYDEQFHSITKPGGGSIWIEEVEIGGTLVGYIVSEPLTPGVAYSISQVGDVAGGTEIDYSNFGSVPCFVSGTCIATPSGLRRIEALRPGDLVHTLDNGPQPILWAGQREVSVRDAYRNPKLVPIQFAGGCHPFTRPSAPLSVSRQHRMLISRPGAQGCARERQVFAPAGAFLSAGLARTLPIQRPFSFHHILFQAHQIVWANGALSESLFPGAVAFDLLGTRAQEEIERVLGPYIKGYTLCRPALTRRQATSLLERAQAPALRRIA